MILTFRSAHLGIAAGLLGAFAGCGSSAPMGNYPDAVVPGGDGGVETMPPRPDAAGDSDGPAKPDPMSGDNNRRVIAGPVRFLVSGPTCTADNDNGDRWCAFLTPSATSPGNLDLFVVNATKAAAGASIQCGGVAPDPNCLRLTRGFFEESDQPAPHAALFQGDTLLFFDVFGTPYAWRPGMLDARQLAQSSGGDVHDCVAARKGTAIMCFRDLPESTGTATVSDVLLGRLDAAAEPPLARVETVISALTADGLRPRFQYGFPTPAGDVAAWSARQTEDGPEVLRARKVDDPASLRTVASNVSHWTASPDGTRWYWLSAYGPLPNGNLVGDLQTAALPDGSGVTAMIPAVHDYFASASGSVVAVNGTLELKSVKDPVTAPSTVIDLDTGVRGLLAVSADHVVYLKRFDSIFPLNDGYVRRIDGTQTNPCTLTTQVDGLRYGLHFLPNSAGLLWARVTSLNVPVGDLPPIDVTLTNLSTCSRALVASQAGDGDWNVGGGAGLYYIDQADTADGSLRFRGLSGPATLAPPPATLIHTRVDSFIPIFPKPGAVLFTVNAGSPKDGLYLNVAKSGQIGQPGTDAGTPAQDAGATDAAGDGGTPGAAGG